MYVCFYNVAAMHTRRNGKYVIASNKSQFADELCFSNQIGTRYHLQAVEPSSSI